MSYKKGNLSREDREFILAKKDEMTAVEISRLLNRAPEQVDRHIKSLAATVPTGADADRKEKVEIRQELRGSEAWRNLKSEFADDELKYFEEAYIKLMSQFKSDGVLPSEETQIFQLIKFELLMSRNLKERRRARDDIERLEKTQAVFLGKFNGDPSLMQDNDRDYSLNLESQLNAARQAEQSRTNEYVKLQERHDALMKSLKAVRDQRVRQVDNAKVSFMAVIKMLNDRDVQRREGRQMELMRLSGEKALVDLGRPTKYEDGNEDSPILSAETVDLGPEEESEDAIEG